MKVCEPRGCSYPPSYASGLFYFCDGSPVPVDSKWAAPSLEGRSAAGVIRWATPPLNPIGARRQQWRKSRHCEDSEGVRSTTNRRQAKRTAPRGRLSKRGYLASRRRGRRVPEGDGANGTAERGDLSRSAAECARGRRKQPFLCEASPGSFLRGAVRAGVPPERDDRNGVASRPPSNQSVGRTRRRSDRAPTDRADNRAEAKVAAKPETKHGSA